MPQLRRLNTFLADVSSQWDRNVFDWKPQLQGFLNISETQNSLLHYPLGVENEFNILLQDSCWEYLPPQKQTPQNSPSHKSAFEDSEELKVLKCILHHTWPHHILFSIPIVQIGKLRVTLSTVLLVHQANELENTFIIPKSLLKIILNRSHKGHLQPV